jgi:DNA-binding MltR family transcriptional regulator
MPNRDALRRLSRKFPARPEIEKIMDGLRDKDDLHIGIIAVSILEARLQQLITTRLHKKGDKDFLNRLFLNRGPLSDLNSKILVAEAFGIVTGPLADELHVMRDIRNAFAHSTTPLSFEHELVKREVDGLKMLEAMRAARIKFSEGNDLTFELSSKSWFLLATRITLIMLDTIAGETGTAAEVVEAALREPE